MARNAAITTAVAALAFLVALAFVFLGGDDEGSQALVASPAAAVASADDRSPSAASAGTAEATEVANAAQIDGTVSAAADVEGTSAASPQATSAPTVEPQVSAPPAPTAARPLSEGYRLRVPSLGVNAIMTDLGVDGDGVMEVPLEAQLVGWYRFTSLPGQPGNTLLGGHITWRGATAVFRYLEAMSLGDTIYIDTPDGQTLEYVVEETWWAEPYTASDIRRVIGTRSGRETVTLFTCGGTWDSADREYSHRRVVTAVRVA